MRKKSQDMQRNNEDMNRHTSVLKAQPRQSISIFVSDQSGYTGSEHMANELRLATFVIFMSSVRL